MSRPHRRKDTSGSAIRARLGARPPAATARSLQELTTAAQQLAQAAGPVLPRPMTAPERQQLRGRWAGHVPLLAVRLARLLDREAEVLAPLGLRGADLLDQEREVRQLWALKETLDRLSQRVADALLVGRAALYSDVQRTLSAVAVLTRGPLARPEVAARLETVSAPARALVAARLARLARRRQQLRALRQAAAPRPPAVLPRRRTAPAGGPPDAPARARPGPSAPLSTAGSPGTELRRGLRSGLDPLGGDLPCALAPPVLPWSPVPGWSTLSPRSPPAPGSPRPAAPGAAPAPVWSGPGPGQPGLLWL